MRRRPLTFGLRRVLKLNCINRLQRWSWVLLALAFAVSSSTWFVAHKHSFTLWPAHRTCAKGICVVTLSGGLFSGFKGQVSASFARGSVHNGAAVNAWSVAGWVRLHKGIDEVYDVTALSFGPMSLKFAAPAVPYVFIETAWPQIQRQYDYKPSLRGHCGDLAIRVSRTTTFSSAVRLCAQMPGCTTVTRNSEDSSTFFCHGVYTLDNRDPTWSSAVLQHNPLPQNYSWAVGVKSWNHFALTYHSGLLHFYINGILHQTQRISAFLNFTQVDLGWSPRWFESAFPGDVRDVRVWRRQLQHNEVVMSASSELPPSDNVLHLAAERLSAAPPVAKSGWRRHALPNQPSDCAASVLVPVLDRTPIEQLQMVPYHLQQHAGESCQVNIFLVACASQNVDLTVIKGAQQSLRILQPEVQLRWDACVRYGLQQAMTQDAESPYFAIVAASLLPLQGWLSGLVSDLQQHTDVSAVFSKILWVNGTIKSFGSRFEQAYDDCLARQVVRPVEMYAGYPWNYGPTMKTVAVQTADCSAWLMRSSGVSKLLENGSFLLSLGSYLACSDMALRLQQAGRSVLVSPLSSFIDTATRAQQEDPAALQSFDQTWGPFLEAQYVSGLAHNATATWVMNCGGFASIEAFNLVQHLEGKLRFRAQMQRGWPFCEHPDVLQDMPRAFSERVYRLRRLSSYLPSDIVIHHKDYRQLAAWPWPPNNSSAYLIGRYSWDLDRIHRQWAEHIKSELDEVWVPSKWHTNYLEQQGVQRNKIFVVPNSVDAHFYDPDIWDPLTLPHQRRLSFLTPFKMDDRASWQAVLVAYLKAFRDNTDVSLYIHPGANPLPAYRRDLVYIAMNTFLQDSNDTYLQSISLFPLPSSGAPHVHVFEQELTQLGLLRISASVDVIIVPTRDEGWGTPYMEAMSLGKPVITTAWGPLGEYIQPDFGFLADFAMTPISTEDKGLRGAAWGEPTVEGLIDTLQRAYESKDLVAMGRNARSRVIEKYNNELVSSLVTKRLTEITRSELLSSRTAKALDMAKGQIPLDIVMCAMLPKPRVRLSRTTPALKLAVVSTAPPRRCGIATFNSALMEYLQPLLPQGSSVEVFPLVWDTEIPALGGTSPIQRRIRQKNYDDYVSTARAINGEGFHAAILQHEFGIWGGAEGSLVVCLARMLEVPVVSVIHSLSDNLQDMHQCILQHLAASSKAVVVMSESSRNKLGAFHGIPSDNVVVLPHGAPVISAVNPVAAKAMLNLTGRTVIMTNGLINPMKGIDVVLKTLPEIVKEFPSVMYLIVGEPHPDCGKPCADYFEELVAAASDHRIANHVRFVTKFLDNRLLLQYVQAADIYVLPYKDRITTNSGTLTMALAAGKAVVSTPFDHAASVLPGRGVLVDFDSPLSLQDGILELLRDDSLRTNYQRAAREFSLGHDWRSVAKGYASLLANITISS
ncbi:hypothetical protein VaNZ11_010076 [Volvox africanus]|uniref:Glycosyl transferase family 1 domain-containing protein n=1 Tax=Volvox africanus TaxID=51714 RepID=A0ABQ5S9L2_9CHLO|nr:hypothetical protein VaNZ11_010076 [Volvox africanus]